MIKQQSRSLALIFLLSIIAIAIWLFEITQIKGWNSLSWISDSLLSPYLISFLTVSSFLSPFILSKQMTKKAIGISIISLYVVSLLCYFGGKQLCLSSYNRFGEWRLQDEIILFSLAVLLFILLSAALWFVTNKFIKANTKFNIFIIAILSFCAIPLSLLTIKINSGFGFQSEWIDSVKMGYPVFWMTMMLGISGMIISGKMKS